MQLTRIFENYTNQFAVALLLVISFFNAHSWAIPLEDDYDEYFKCGIGGESIEMYEVCDGHKDCRNGADEQDCRGVKCPGYTFQCRYGACIRKNAVCDGRIDCLDASDETSFRCGHCAEATQMQCPNGVCIDKLRLCDGNSDCSDGSDETELVCKFETCNQQQYRCHYGACIDAQRRCDGHTDCIDGSDERGCLSPVTHAPRIAFPNGIDDELADACEIPLHYEHLRAHNQNRNAAQRPGSKVGSSTRVLFSCAPGTVMHGEHAEVLCKRDGWQYAVPRCFVYCNETAVTDSITTTISCERGNGEVIECTHILPGTVAKLHCANNYRLPFAEWRFMMSRTCQDNGTWSGEYMKCVPVCGTAASSIIDNAVQGVDAAMVPWHVEIYSSVDTDDVNNYQRICSGTIIATNLVITAAHCFEMADSELYDKDYFRVIAAGVRRNITTILTEGYDQFRHDVALLVLTAPMHYNHEIHPICMEWTQTVGALGTAPQAGKVTGHVVGRNVAPQNGQPVKRYRRIEVSATSNADCSKTRTITTLGNGYQLHADKFCIEPAQHYQMTAQLCPGDSGAGVVVRANNVYHLIGIVSHAPGRQLDCTTGLVTATNIKNMPRTLRKLIDDTRAAELK